MKRILVPFDFSDFSKEALKFAVNFAKMQKAELVLLYAIHIPVMFVPTLPEAGALGYDPTFFKTMEDDATKEFDKILEELDLPESAISYKILYGEVDDTIVYESDVQHADLIIMGTAGHERLNGPFIGTTTEKVVRHAKAPVLIIRKAVPMKSIKNILLPSQLMLNQTEIMEMVKDLQEQFKATLHVLLVNTPEHFMTDNTAHELQEDFVKHYQLTNCKTYFRNYATEEAGIVDFAIHNDMNLIIMPTHGRKGLSHLLYGSITEEVLNSIECAIMTVNLKK